MSIIDRITPTVRPHRALAGYQKWRELLFMHWPVDAAMLRPLVPASLEIDTWEGQAFVGIVPFAMERVRPWTIWPGALGFNFLETNVRTYVHVDGQDPGVYFFSLDAASWLAVKAARTLWSLPYFSASMQSNLDGDRYHYESHRKNADASLTLDAELGKVMGAADPESLEFFLFERYLLHVERAEVLMTGQVYHTPYPTHLATLNRCEQTLLEAAGMTGLGAPSLVHYSPGVDVDIFPLQPRS